MIKKYKEFINEGIFDLLSGYSMDEVKEKFNRLTPNEKYIKLKQLNLKYQDIYTQEEINNFTGLDKVLASNIYDFVDGFYENRAWVRIFNKIGIIDENGNELTPIKYHDIGEIHKNFIFIILNNKFGIIDINGNELTPFKYDNIFNINDNIIKVKINDKYGLVDKTGKEITQIKYDSIGNFFNNKALVELNNKSGYIDIDGYEYWY